MSTESPTQKFFYDKRDKNYIELASDNGFYELFSVKERKCPILIPETIIFNNNGIESWFFVKDGQVMMKNTKKLNMKDLFLFLQKRFQKKQSLFYASADGQIPILLPENESDREKIAVVKMKTDERLGIDLNELKKLIDDKLALISYAQVAVNVMNQKDNPIDASETYYCDYRLEPEQTTPLIKYYKKYTKNNPTKSDLDVFKNLFPHGDKDAKAKSQTIRNPNLILDYLNNLNNSQPKAHKPNLSGIIKNLDRIFSGFKTCRLFYKSMDNKLNSRLCEEIGKLIAFFESCFYVRIRRIIAKFLIDSDNNLIFMGATKICVDGIDAPKQVLTMEELFIKAEELAHQRREEKRTKFQEVEKKILEKQNEGKTAIYSKNLLNRLNMERCSGDLCKFFFLQNIKGVIQHKKMDYIGQKILPFTQKNLGSSISDKLPFAILHKTIINTRVNWAQLIPILKKNLIVPQNHEKVLKSNSVDDLSDSEYALEEKHWVDNPYEYYKKVKVCEKCYYIYSFIVSTSESMIQEEIKNQNKKWVHSEKKFLMKIRDIGESGTKTRGGPDPMAGGPQPNPERRWSQGQKLNKIEAPSLRTSANFNKSAVSSKQLNMSSKSMNQTAGEGMSLLLAGAANNLDNDPSPKAKSRLTRFLAKGESRYSIENEEPVDKRQPVIHAGARSSTSVMEFERRKSRKNKTLLEPESPSKAFRNKSMSTAEIIIDSTRMNMGLILSKGEEGTAHPKKNARLSQIVYPRDEEDIPEKSESSMSGRKVNPLFFGIPATEEYKSSRIKEAKEKLEFIHSEVGSPTRRSADVSVNSGRKSSDLNKIKERRKSTKMLLLISLEKTYEKSPMKVNEFIDKKQKLLRENDNKIFGPVSIFHYKTSHLRVHQDHLIHIPKMCIHPPNFKCTMDLEQIDFRTFLSRVKDSRAPGVKPFETESLDDLYNINGTYRKVNVFVYSETTAIPYMILESKKRDSSEFAQETLVIINDFFDNFLEKVEFYAKLMRKMLNKKIVLFNFPGQAYTVFSPTDTWNNETISCLIDGLLFHLNKVNKINLSSERLKFLGFGYGGNILTYFISSSESALTALNSVLLANSFSYIDALLFQTLLDCIANFENVPEDLPELPFCYFYALTCTKPLNVENMKKRVRTNPISIADRVSILKGCFSGISCKSKVGYIRCPIYSLHSLQNSLVRISHTDINCSINADKTASALEAVFSEPVTFYKNSSFIPKRSNTYIEGGHDLIEEVPEKLMKIIEEYFLIK